MNWMRSILDGIAIAAYFNLFAEFAALYRTRLMLPYYPPAIIKTAMSFALSFSWLRIISQIVA